MALVKRKAKQMFAEQFDNLSVPQQRAFINGLKRYNAVKAKAMRYQAAARQSAMFLDDILEDRIRLDEPRRPRHDRAQTA